jgi:hypothetical protein
MMGTMEDAPLRSPRRHDHWGLWIVGTQIACHASAFFAAFLIAGAGSPLWQVAPAIGVTTWAALLIVDHVLANRVPRPG